MNDRNSLDEFWRTHVLGIDEKMIHLFVHKSVQGFQPVFAVEGVFLRLKSDFLLDFDL